MIIIRPSNTGRRRIRIQDSLSSWPEVLPLGHKSELQPTKERKGGQKYLKNFTNVARPSSLVQKPNDEQRDISGNRLLKADQVVQSSANEKLSTGKSVRLKTHQHGTWSPQNQAFSSISTKGKRKKTRRGSRGKGRRRSGEREISRILINRKFL